MKTSLLLITTLNILSIFGIGILFLSNLKMENEIFWSLVLIVGVNAITAKSLLKILKKN